MANIATSPFIERMAMEFNDNAAKGLDATWLPTVKLYGVMMFEVHRCTVLNGVWQ